MRRILFLALLVPAAAACTDQGTQIIQDTPIAVAASADRVVVAATEETETTGFGCGGGGGSYGRSVLFVSADRGTTFERIVPDDQRPLTHVVSRDGVFYGVAHSNDGGYGVVTSADGLSWTEVASGGTRYAEDLAISEDAIVVAHGAGILASTDGTTWVEHAIGGAGNYQARVAHTGGMFAVGGSADGTLRLSADARTWRSYTVPGFLSIGQLIGAGDSLLVAGYTDDGSAVARIDLTNLTAAPVVHRGFSATGAVLTPAGLLDVAGWLAPFTSSGLGSPVFHLSPFNAAAVDQAQVVVVRGETLEASSDGGRTFGSAISLPIERVEKTVSEDQLR